MFFYIKQKYNPQFCMISDINEDLIEAFIAVRDHPKKIINVLESLANKDSELFYYHLRDVFNKREINGIILVRI